jgi:hypothetical protein
MIRAISFQTFNKKDTNILLIKEGKITLTKRKVIGDYMILAYDKQDNLIAMDFGNEKMIDDKIKTMQKYMNSERNPFF